MKRFTIFTISCLYVICIGKPILMFGKQFSKDLETSACREDTMLVWTTKTPLSEEKHYVINGKREMRIYISDGKRDTTIFADICDYTMEKYKMEVNNRKIRELPIEKIDADMVFTYFKIGESIEEVTLRLGKKKVHVSNRGYEVIFFNKFSKKDEVFELCFINGKLSSIGRPSTNTLPTNNVWMAFQLLELKDILDNLKKIH